MRTFTLVEAEALLPELEPLLARALHYQAKIAHIYREAWPVLEHAQNNVGTAATSALVSEFILLEKTIKQIRAYGCRVEDIRVGFLDFPAVVNGREVYLCWRYGEKEITHYHDLGGNFIHRHQIKSLST